MLYLHTFVFHVANVRLFNELPGVIALYAQL